MATVQERNHGSFRILFMWHGRREMFTLGKVSRPEAESKAAQVDYLLMRLGQRLIEVPPGVSVVEFLRHDGKPPIGSSVIPERQVLTLGAFRNHYLDTHRESLEPRSIQGIELHFRHLTTVLGERFPIRELKLTDLQGYVDARAKAKGSHGKRLSVATIKKEIISLRTAWNWGVKLAIVDGRFPYDGLRFAKTDEKPPFMTRDQIERQLTGGGLSRHQQAELWHSLYLQKPEIEEALEAVRQYTIHRWIYAMACTAAYTGARRSELMRMRPTDIDFLAKAVIVREKKRVRGQHTTRRIPLTPFLAKVLKDYLTTHPGGQSLFCHAAEVERSRNRSKTTGHQSGEDRAKTLGQRLATVKERVQPALSPLSESEANDHLKRALKASHWAIIKGWHVFRHAFVAACANKGIDQRFIDEWCGHMTEQQRRRYRHLYPSTQQSALESVFE